MAPANPYKIHIQLFWPSGIRPSENQIARVNAYDVGTGAPVWQGQSGYDSNTGGWQDIVLQNTGAFASQRDFANLMFEVVSTTEATVHSTQVFQAIHSESTVKIVIGQSDVLVGTWTVSGVVTDGGAPVSVGMVKAYDVMDGDEALLGTDAPDANGHYWITFSSDAFQNHGAAHSNPNLLVKYYDQAGTLVAQSPLYPSVGQETTIDLQVGGWNQTGDYRVFGQVRNELGLPVAGLLVQAYNLQWTVNGIEEVFLGHAMAGGAGEYEILYSPQFSTNQSAACAGAAAQDINLIVYAKAGDLVTPGNQLSQGGPVLDAGKHVELDLRVDLISTTQSSEYSLLHDRIWDCLGTNAEARWLSLNQLTQREDYRSLIARSLDVDPELVLAYANAWVITGRINEDIAWGQSSPGIPPSYTIGNFDELDAEVIYALLRLTDRSSLEQVLELAPPQFFDTIVDAINEGIVSRSLEDRLGADDVKPLQEQWRLVLAHYLTHVEDPQNPSSDPTPWQSELLGLVISDAATREKIAALSYDIPGTFKEFLEELASEDPPIITNEAVPPNQVNEQEDLLFVFELYEAADQFMPLVKEVYSKKATYLWKTIADLSKIPLDSITDTNSWTHYAGGAAGRNAGSFPASVPGKTWPEKQRVYAQRLFDRFGAAEPVVRFLDQAAASTDAGISEAATVVQAVMETDPDFELSTTPIDAYLLENGISISSDGLTKLKALQRVVRLHPDYKVAEALILAGYDSAVVIAREDEDDFIVAAEEILGGLTAARAVYRKAKLYAGDLYSTVLRYNQNLNDVGGSTALAVANLNLNDVTFTQNSEKFPNWVTLFGGLNSCMSKHCQTVLSPGAYLADLLEWVDGTPKRTLFARRPDLEDIELTCPNTERVLPYIDLVIEALENIVMPHEIRNGGFTVSALDGAASGGDPSATLQALAHAGYLLTERARVKLSPFDGGAGQAREWIVEDDAWRFTLQKSAGGSDSSIVAYGAAQTSATGDLLEVFPEHANPAANAELEAAVFPLNLPLSLGREEVELVLDQRRTSRAEILDVFRRGRSVANPDLSIGPVLKDAQQALAYLKLISSEGSAILLDESSVQLREYWGFEHLEDPGDDQQPVTIPRPESPTEGIQGPWQDLMAVMSVFMHRTGLSYREVQRLLDTEFVHGGAAMVTITAEDDDLLECNYPRFRLTNLTHAALKRMGFFLRLKNVLGWEMRVLDRILMRLGPPSFNANAGVPGDLTLIAQVQRFARDFGLDVEEVPCLWVDLDTRRTEREPRSTFDRIYLRGALTSEESKALESLAQGKLSVLIANEDENGDGTGDQNSSEFATTADGFKGVLRGALRVSAGEVDVLWNTVVATQAELTLAHLSEMYRVARFSQAMRIGVEDFYRLFNAGPTQGLLGQVAFGAAALPTLEDRIAATFATAEEVRRLIRSGLSVREWDYLLRHQQRDGEGLGPSLTDHRDTLRQLTEAAAALFERYPKVLIPDAELLGVLLSEVMPPEQVPQVLEILRELPSDLTGATALFTRYFVFADTTLITAILGGGITTPAERRAAVFAPLRSYLIERARVDAALRVASASVDASAERVGDFLNNVLTRVNDDTQPAIGDWVAGLGGWDNGLETIEDQGAGSYASTWIVPADGDYRFVLSVKGVSATESEVHLTIAGSVLTNPTTAIVDGRTQLTYPDVFTLKAGATLELSLGVDPGSSQTVSLLVQKDNDNPSLLPPEQLSAFDADALVRLSKALMLVDGLALSNSELDYLNFKTFTVDGSAILDDLPLHDFDTEYVPWARIRWFVDQLALNRRVALDGTTLFEEWRFGGPREAIRINGQPVTTKQPLDSARTAKLTGWRQQDLDLLLGNVSSDPGLWDAPVSLDAPETWFVLERCMKVLERVDLKAAQLLSLLVDATPSARVAGILRDSFRSQFTDESWSKTFKPLRDALRQRHRDALVGYLTSRAIIVSGKSQNFFDANDLYAFFLIDVEMEPDTQLSRVKLALNTVQLFVHRVFMGLEGDLVLKNLEKKKAQWAWMRNYRVWEANRKVFLYPENWVEPELRDDKTELFATVEEQLLQEETTSERGRLTLANYLQGMDELNQLKVVGACTEGVFTNGKTSVLHIVGRTRAKPYSYYHRSFEGRQFNDGVFTPWKHIPLEIDHDTVAPVIVGGSLWLFWPMFQEKQKVAQDTGQTSTMSPTVEIRFLWSSLVPETGTWSKPKLGSEKIIDTSVASIFDRNQSHDGPHTGVYHFRTAVEDGTVQVEVIKTALGDAGQYVDPAPKSLGILRVNQEGEESRVPPTQPGTTLKLNVNHFADSIPEANRSHSVDESTFRMEASNDHFLKKQYYGALATNFGDVEDANNQPFFVDAPKHSMLGLYREPGRNAGLSPELHTVAKFITFNHPVLDKVKARFRADGPSGIMDRLTQALPTSEDRYYYNASGGRLSYTTGSYESGYNNSYNYYGGIYLGYHIANDRRAWGVTQRDFEETYYPTDSVERHYPLPTVEFGYGKPFGVYNWELFFHLPLLIADRLTQEMRFDEAMDWYHFIFDPRQDLHSYEKTKRWALALPAGARYWKFLPFFANANATDSLLDTFGVTATLSSYERENLKTIIAEWRNNPFNPHLIARQRVVAYQKSTVMKYLDNLIAWGDHLFRQDTFESINEATQLYILASEVLGKRPEIIEPVLGDVRYTYRELKKLGITPFTNALVEAENLLVSHSEDIDGAAVDRASHKQDLIERTTIQSLYFRIPRNEALDKYWDMVSDRVFKIRNSMNIDGVKRTLALFAPPIDPALLVKAVANGIDLSTVLAQLNRPQPHYRFRVWSQKASDLAGEVKSFGAALLSALEKKDGEELARLRQTHEVRVLNLAREVRREQADEAAANIAALESSRRLAEDRFNNYSARVPRNEQEQAAARYTTKAENREVTAGVLNTIGGALHLVPQVAGGFASATVEFGGNHLGSLLQAIATGISVSAGVARSNAGQASTEAGYVRRQEDWDLQKNQAQLEMANIDQQIVGAEIRRSIAEKELNNHDVQIEQSLEVQEFLQEKFSNQELYNWMTKELSRTYRRVYALAYDVAKTAEHAYRFELGVDSTCFVQDNYFEGRYQGLLAGERLGHDIKRMDIAYLEQNKREFEITKPISLLNLDPAALQLLRETGACEFSLPEVIFDLDFPGQYFRRIRAVRLTVPCVTGPYTSVSAKLSLLSSAVRTQSTADDGDYGYKGFDDGRFAHRTGNIQSIATSSAQDDGGLFELNFNDERYLPFEGSGVVSRWRLELPQVARQFDYHSISDVVVHLSYTARDAGGSLFEAVKGHLTEMVNGMLELVAANGTGLVRVFSMKREFPDALHRLLTTSTATISLLPEHFPYLLREQGYSLQPVSEDSGNVGLTIIAPSLSNGPANFSLALNGGTPQDASATYSKGEGGALGSTVPRGSADIVSSWLAETWSLQQSGELTVGNVDDILFTLKYTVS